MNAIYTPRGKAREYSPQALNIYMKCTHRCRYCYAPGSTRKSMEDYFVAPAPRLGLVDALKRQLARGVAKEQVLLSFIGDVYCETQDNNRTTREVLELLCEHEVPTAVLTKGGTRCLKDLDLFKEFGGHIQVGTTLTFSEDSDSLYWEAGAALPGERIMTLKTLHEAGIRTFASFEPVIVPAQSLALMERCVREDCVDVFKVGKLNHMPDLEATIDWADFLTKALALLRPSGKMVYIKEDLRNAAPGVALKPEECDMDRANVN